MLSRQTLRGCAGVGGGGGGELRRPSRSASAAAGSAGSTASAANWAASKAATWAARFVRANLQVSGILASDVVPARAAVCRAILAHQ
jgi:hypothetical protein